MGSYFLFFKAFLATFWVSLVTILEVPLPFSRPRIDRRVKWWAEALMNSAEVHITVEYDDPIALESHRPYMIMCNHRSWYDIPISIVALEQWTIRMLAKKELFHIPLWASAMRRSEFIAIDRSDPQKALESLDQAMEKMKDGVMVWIAPEGTRSKTGALGEFKPGGFKMAVDTGTILIPTVILGSEHIMPRGEFGIRKGQNVVLRLGTPIDASQYGPKGRKKVMVDLRTEMERLLSLDSMSHSYRAPLNRGEDFPQFNKTSETAEISEQDA